MLTDYIVEHAKPGPKAIRLSDARGLYLAVLPNGSKLWRLDFRFDGRRLTASFGPYPDISLEAAREANARARTMIRAGLNPITEKRVALQTAKLARLESRRQGLQGKRIGRQTPSMRSIGVGPQ